MPTVDHVGVSRKIATDEERQRLKRVINENRTGLPGGFIVRTAAEGRSESEFVQDIRFLGNLWSDIRSKSEKKSAPALIHADLNLVQRTLRDQLSEDFHSHTYRQRTGICNDTRLRQQVSARTGQSCEAASQGHADIRGVWSQYRNRQGASAKSVAEVRRIYRDQPDRGSRCRSM
jgi:Rne/Rng family ribonuclease